MPNKKFEDPGMGTTHSFNSKRIINKDGSFNVLKSGLKPNMRNTYQVLIKMSWLKFLSVIFAFLFLINACFALLYLAVGVEALGLTPTRSIWNNFLEAYFFSFQTFTTVGYGALSPVGHLANIIASLEAI
ncbi:MAG: ion channel, partial [Fulvivirga sp.]|nr:ion channel [Fulvivirga sp.]